MNIYIYIQQRVHFQEPSNNFPFSGCCPGSHWPFLKVPLLSLLPLFLCPGLTPSLQCEPHWPPRKTHWFSLELWTVAASSVWDSALPMSPWGSFPPYTRTLIEFCLHRPELTICPKKPDPFFSILLLFLIFLHGTHSVQFSSVQSLSCVRLFATPWITARQASLSMTNPQSSLRLTSIESVMPSSHLILCRPLLLLPQSLPASESSPMSQLFAWGGQSTGVSALA